MTRHILAKSPLTIRQAHGREPCRTAPLFQRGEFLPLVKGGKEGFSLLGLYNYGLISKSGANLKIGVDFSVTLNVESIRSLESDLRQTLEDLGLREKIRIEQSE